MSETPIVILSFNRPNYLGQLLDSLNAQTALDNRPIYLFQDNAVSPFSAKRVATDEDIAACIAIFREKVPGGTVMLAQHNLGVARNYLRAEEFIFNDRKSEVAYFFEDDLVLSPHYLTMLDQMAAYASDAKVGYFACYGRLRLTHERQRPIKRRLTLLGMHWGVGLMRKHWLDLREWLDPYYRMCDGLDYRKRPTTEIALSYRARGYSVLGTNQDMMKKAGSYSLGHTSLNTNACFARYIGAVGLHSSEESYARTGFGKTELFPDPVELRFPRPRALERLHKEALADRWRILKERAEAAAAAQPKSSQAATKLVATTGSPSDGAND